MADKNVSLECVQDFLAQKRIAMVGVSRNPKDFTVMLFEEFRRRGYDIVPVNPAISEFCGQRCFARVQEIQPGVDAAILMTSPAITEKVVHDCADAGIRRVWMYGAGVSGATSPAAVEFCREKGIEVVQGHCPFMFWSDSHIGHRLHGLVLKVIGKYPGRKMAAAA